MYKFRYYAIGHSYLKHGPFPGWQTEGFWGMAASAPENDYFHKLQDLLRHTFDCDVEAIAENHATYERLCVDGVTEETYKNSEEYSHMRDVLTGFKPNIVTLLIGGGNTPAKDDVSLTRFFEVLYALVAEYKLPETVVVCPTIRTNLYRIAKPIGDRYGFITVDVTYLHKVKGRENPYYAYKQYPEYDERAASGAVEFRTHPNDLGHKSIAESIIGAARSAIGAIPEGDFTGEYSYGKYLMAEKPERLKIMTEPEMSVSYYGFNIRQEGECVVFGSAPGTGASLAADGLAVAHGCRRFYAEMLVDGSSSDDTLTLTVTRDDGTEEYTQSLCSGMCLYEFDISDGKGAVKGFRLAPSSPECVVTVRALGFKK